ncbi:MAG: cation-translocating P-type ATPase [Acidobacteria bacterium]|nr:cation-translocating P-type ATPase [Acidobacteriota bacterium]
MTKQRIECDCGDEAPASVWWRIGAGAFLAMNAMVLGVAVNGSDVTREERLSLELSILCVAVAVFGLLAKEFVEAIWQAVKLRRLGIELLLLLGIAASLGASGVSLATGKGGTYSDVAGLLLVIYSLGRQVGAYGKARVFKSLGDWAPERRMARRLDGTRTNAAEIKQGESFRVLPGEPVPVDAKIVAGPAYFHEATLTGESFARSRGVGETVEAGAYLIDASVDCVALKDGGEARLDQIRDLVSAGLAVPGREQSLAIAAMRWFGPVVIAISVATFWWHSHSGDWASALFAALSVLVIACPCALGFATPLAVWSAIARLRELGILARSGEAVEKLAETDTIVFDKTGTLTLPEEYEASWTVNASWQGRESELRFLLREAETASRHPIATALGGLWEGKPVDETTQLEQIRLIPGEGIEARFSDGRLLFAGARGGSRNLEVKIDGKLAASITLREICEQSVPDTVLALESAGLKVMLSTGDAAERASAIPIGRQLVRQSPLDKHSAVASLEKAGGKVLFVGDGLNDVAAMAWSSASLTLSTSVELVRDVSGFVMLHQDWRALPQAIAIARAARQTVRRNIAFSLGYNAIGIGFAACGWLHPVAAALLMLASSMTVILDSMRLMDWEANEVNKTAESAL